MSKELHAWYSHKAVEGGSPSSFYKREDGQEVEVTNVSENIDSEYLWDDKEYLGTVAKWSRIGVRPRRI